MPNEVTPAFLQGSNMRFYVPPTIQSDFTNYLNTDIPNATHSFELVPDWYARQQPGYTPTFIRATYFPVDWKSKVGNSDMSSNFKTNFEHTIHKGDYVVGEDGRVYMLTWWVANHINNQATQATACNAFLTITRNIPEVTDSMGYRVTDTAIVSGEKKIANECPANVTEYASKPEYIINTNSPGIVPDALVSATFQCNPTTLQIRIDDEFVWGHFKYRVIDTVFSEVDIDGTTGVLGVYAKRVAGGISYEY